MNGWTVFGIAAVCTIFGTFLGFFIASLFSAGYTSDASPSEVCPVFSQENKGPLRKSYFKTNFWQIVHKFFPSVREELYDSWINHYISDVADSSVAQLDPVKDFLLYLCNTLSEHEGISEKMIEYVFLKNDRTYNISDYYRDAYYPVFQEEFSATDKSWFEKLIREYLASTDKDGYAFVPFRGIWRKDANQAITYFD